MPRSVNLPEGYHLVEAGVSWGFAVEDARTWLRETLASDPPHVWAARHPDRRKLQGRGPASSVPAPARGPSGADRWVVRHYTRGGAMAGWLGDRYLAMGVPRPLLELHAALAARRRGIPTPCVVAGTVHPASLFYRADLVTEEIPGGVDLADVLFGEARTVESDAAARAAGALAHALEAAGVLHRDLNAKNVVVHLRGGVVRAHVVDLDGCRVGAPGVWSRGHPMRRRLERSLRKHESRSGRSLDAGIWAALREGFASGASLP